MKKWLALIALLIILSGCSWQKTKKWLDGLEWERDDQTIRVVDILIR